MYLPSRCFTPCIPLVSLLYAPCIRLWCLWLVVGFVPALPWLLPPARLWALSGAFSGLRQRRRRWLRSSKSRPHSSKKESTRLP